ncbi:lymphoid-specific helicase-like [Actinia tenebrosa]|uniref:Lymphoid-specific helicase-like n=1 Tax=Actinia tenebrosa TaxID=6105 RepID=A0A6P8IM06_ACTTE|nr:lymphoid-specific helicase-like [Actinia tenebrosa]
MSFISKAFEYFVASPAKADPVSDSNTADIENNIQDLPAETEMSPLTEDNDNGDDSSASEYDVNDDEGCITDTMKAEENKIHQQTVKKENKEKIECMDEWAAMQEGQKFARLQHLLNKSNIYCQFLLKRMEEQRENEEKKQKRMAKRQENKEIKEATKPQQVQRRSARRKENDQSDSQGSTDNDQPEPTLKTKKGRKRKAEQSTSKLSDYITEEAIVKRQKMNESKSPPRTPLSNRSPEQCVPNTPKSASPKKEKAVTVEGDVHTSQPSLLTGGVMRGYQIEGLEWLKVLYENGVNGILADEMGLGKTVQCIGLIAHLIEMGVKGPFLVAAPLSTLPNWVSEFHRFTPKIPVILYHGSIEERTILRRKIDKLVAVGPYVSQPVIVTSYEICMNDQKHLYNYQWKHMIVDEGHRIKNLNCRLIRELKTYDSANRLLLTGTPLQNNLQELWSLLNFLLPDIFDDLSSFQRLFDFSAIGDEESKERILAQEREHQVLKTLHSILTPFLLRRLKSDVELSLPPKKELLVYAPLTKKQTTFYKAALDKTIENIVGPQKNKKEEIIEINSAGRPVRKKRLNINYKVFDAQDFEELANTLTEMKTTREPEMRTTNQQQHDSVVSIPLRNILMLLRKCCNHPYLLEYPLDPATQQFKIDEELVSCSGKMKILDQLLAGLRAKGHKVLIFSQMTKMLDILEDFCYLRKYNYCRLDGAMSVQDRREQMKAFTTDSNVFLFLLSTRAGGLGLNLSAADTVIIYDSDWPFHISGKFKGKLDDNVLSAEELRDLLEAASHDQVIANDGLLLSKKQLSALLDRSDLIAQHNEKNRTVPDVDSTDSALFKVIDSSS